MHIRCKAGDLAIITQEEIGCEGNIGRFVTVHGPFKPRENGASTWRIVPVCNQPYSFVERDGSIVAAAVQLSDDIEHPDCWMVPIRPDIEDCDQTIEEPTGVSSRLKPTPLNLSKFQHLLL